MIQTTSSQPGEPTCRAMIEETIKMPEPIIDPATIIVESSKPRPRTNPVRVCSVGVTSSAIALLTGKFAHSFGLATPATNGGGLDRASPREIFLLRHPG